MFTRRCPRGKLRDPHMRFFPLHASHRGPEHFGALEGWWLGIEELVPDDAERDADGEGQAKHNSRSSHGALLPSLCTSDKRLVCLLPPPKSPTKSTSASWLS